MLQIPDDQSVIVIADGAAFGAFIDSIIQIRNTHSSIGLYLPESFEWLILKSGILTDADLLDILEHPDHYIESRQYFSWERFFTELLEEKTKGDKYKQYHKEKLSDYYTSKTIAKKIIDIMPDEIQKYLNIQMV